MDKVANSTYEYYPMVELPGITNYNWDIGSIATNSFTGTSAYSELVYQQDTFDIDTSSTLKITAGDAHIKRLSNTTTNKYYDGTLSNIDFVLNIESLGSFYSRYISGYSIWDAANWSQESGIAYFGTGQMARYTDSGSYSYTMYSDNEGGYSRYKFDNIEEITIHPTEVKEFSVQLDKNLLLHFKGEGTLEVGDEVRANLIEFRRIGAKLGLAYPGSTGLTSTDRKWDNKAASSNRGTSYPEVSIDITFQAPKIHLVDSLSWPYVNTFIANK